MFQVDQSVPIPTVRQQKSYPFSQMNVGDSFLIPEADKKKTASVRACASVYGKKNNVRFTCKQVEGGVRVWRVS